MSKCPRPPLGMLIEVGSRSNQRASRGDIHPYSIASFLCANHVVKVIDSIHLIGNQNSFTPPAKCFQCVTCNYMLMGCEFSMRIRTLMQNRRDGTFLEDKSCLTGAWLDIVWLQPEYLNMTVKAGLYIACSVAMSVSTLSLH
jgi:hypothetical protein